MIRGKYKCKGKRKGKRVGEDEDEAMSNYYLHLSRNQCARFGREDEGEGEGEGIVIVM